MTSNFITETERGDDETYRDYLRKSFDQYLNDLDKILNYHTDPSFKSDLTKRKTEIIALIDGLLESINFYLIGYPSKAQESFDNAMTKIEFNLNNLISKKGPPPSKMAVSNAHF